MASSSNRITSLRRLCLTATTVRHLAKVYRADIFGATSVRPIIPFDRRRRRSVDSRIDALDGAVAGERDRPAAEVAGHTGSQRQRAGGHRITAGVDAEVRAVRLDVL